jgi:KaiC/GvpD/RAD55 family RecA-like ATPase
MVQLILLRSLFERDVYRHYRQAIEVSEENQPILDAIDLWYRNNTDDPKIGDIVVNVETIRPRNREYVQNALERLWSLEKPRDLSTLLRQVKNAQIASKLALEWFRVSEGNGSMATALQLTKEIEAPYVLGTDFVTTDLEQILRTTTGTRGLRWRLPWLNRSLGSLRKGDFGFIFARPETGKTTFLASECTHFAGQVGEGGGPVLWFNNEEQGNKVQLRCYQAALGATVKQIRDNPERARAAYKERTGDHIRIVDDAGCTASRVESIVAKESPSLIIFDQIDKVKGFKNDREDLALGATYQWARELAKEYAPVIGVCQASGEAEGEPYLHMGHVSNARTSKQAEADFIIGIGKTHQSGYEFIRYFNISKNKLVGDDDSDPASRHGRQEIMIKPEIARYEEIQ